MKTQLLIALAAYAALQSCAPAKQLQTPVNYPAGHTLKYRQQMRSETETTIFGEKQFQESSNTTEYNYRLVEILPDGNQRWEMVIQRFASTQESVNGDEVTFDTQDPGRDTSRKSNLVYERMIGQPMYMVARPNGDIISFSGTEVLLSKMTEPIQDLPELAPMIRSLSATFNDSVMLETVKNMWGEYPKKAVRVGEKWVKKKKSPGMIPLQTVYQYRLASRNGEQAIISAKSLSIESDKSSPELDLGVIKATYQLKGKGSGQIVINQPMGVFMASKMVVELKGSMRMHGAGIPEMDVPMSTKTTITIESIR